MKGISMKSNVDLLLIKSIPLHRNPVIDFCSILQYASEKSYQELSEICAMMYVLANNRNKRKNKNVRMSKQLNVNISFNQNVFKRKLTHIFMSEFIMSISILKEAKITQSKRYPRPDTEDAFAVYPPNWMAMLVFTCIAFSFSSLR